MNVEIYKKDRMNGDLHTERGQMNGGLQKGVWKSGGLQRESEIK
jgi:hypothetical protein